MPPAERQLMWRKTCTGRQHTLTPTCELARIPQLLLGRYALIASVLGLCCVIEPTSAQLLHHSGSPYGPWEPVVPEGCNGSTGIWRDGGGNNQSPFYITESVAAATGLPVDSLVAVTTHNISFFAVGIAKNWTSPMLIQEQPPPFKNPGTVSWEDPYIYFDLQKRIWRVLYHEVPGRSTPGIQPMPGIHTHCGGYAESVTPDIWGDWNLSPPQCGGYTLDIVAFVGLESTTTVAAAAPPRLLAPAPPPSISPCNRTPPYIYGKSYPAFASENLTSWGGNAVAGDDGKYHMFTSAMSNGRNGNTALSDLIPGPCSGE
jgi:hypothetical protein